MGFSWTMMAEQRVRLVKLPEYQCCSGNGKDSHTLADYTLALLGLSAGKMRV